MPNCPLRTGLRPCECDLPRCKACGYTKHDAAFEGDHVRCPGKIPEHLPASGAEVADAVAAERERCAKAVRTLIGVNRRAGHEDAAEELGAALEQIEHP